jgi:hypothetical protein
VSGFNKWSLLYKLRSGFSKLAGDLDLVAANAAANFLASPTGDISFPDGREATIGILSDGSFFGEGSLAVQPLRKDTATAMTLRRHRILRRGARHWSTVIFIGDPGASRSNDQQEQHQDASRTKSTSFRPSTFTPAPSLIPRANGKLLAFRSQSTPHPKQNIYASKAYTTSRLSVRWDYSRKQRLDFHDGNVNG